LSGNVYPWQENKIEMLTVECLREYESIYKTNKMQRSKKECSLNCLIPYMSAEDVRELEEELKEAAASLAQLFQVNRYRDLFMPYFSPYSAYYSILNSTGLSLFQNPAIFGITGSSRVSSFWWIRSLTVMRPWVLHWCLTWTQCCGSGVLFYPQHPGSRSGIIFSDSRIRSFFLCCVIFMKLGYFKT
jgi:hypothetical protein